MAIKNKPWRWVAIYSLASGLVMGLLGMAFILYLIVAAEDNPDDLCEMTEIGEGLLPYGSEGGCNPYWLMWGIAFLYYASLGMLPVAGIGTIVVLTMRLWRVARSQMKDG